MNVRASIRASHRYATAKGQAGFFRSCMSAIACCTNATDDTVLSGALLWNGAHRALCL